VESSRGPVALKGGGGSMPMDFNYTTEPEDDPVYHVLFMCPEAQTIQDKHHKYGMPPLTDRRRPCQVCLDTVGSWLRQT
jgi:hypothetical protein